MNRESKIAFLCRYGQMKERMYILIERRKAYESDCYGIKATVFSDMPKGGGKRVDLSDKVVKLLTMTEDIDNELDDLQVKMNYIKVVLRKMPDYQQMSVLEMKYVDGLTRKQIAGILNISEQGLDKRIKKALNDFIITQDDINYVI